MENNQYGSDDFKKSKDNPYHLARVYKQRLQDSEKDYQQSQERVKQLEAAIDFSHRPMHEIRTEIIQEQKVRIGQLEASLREVTNELKLPDYDHSCDHSVGVCSCHVFRMIDKAESLLSPEPQKARNHSSPIIQEVLANITPEQQAKVEKEMMASPEPNNPVVEKKDNWISVKDRLPEGAYKVLIAWENSDSDPKVDFYCHSKKDWSKYRDVTHWQPLPEPPVTK